MLVKPDRPRSVEALKSDQKRPLVVRSADQQHLGCKPTRRRRIADEAHRAVGIRAERTDRTRAEGEAASRLRGGQNGSAADGTRLALVEHRQVQRAGGEIGAVV